MHIQKLKVRPRKRVGKNICGAQLATMLGCWAATNDLHSRGPCTEAAQDLFHCMRTTYVFQAIPGKQPKSSINYHLARLGKNLK
ncbi:hypothetical protein PILCRDRAFT_72687 [Piloderma croceum F 1598]|uniref:CHCH domain-containing protein n=1 Tax=Piloderma croceum (strain F 1598) TaxID=765440 RepID=A0A0C3F852_PILCF|nr:hypothetical protein PILCRDRAFT_72687 [Piloderma croceum F 1598]